MIGAKNIKTINGLQYYTGSHPVMKEHNKFSGRPSEFGHKVWATTLVLIDFLSVNKFNLENKRILEVGCGWGVLGLYLARDFHSNVMLTDKDAKVLPIVQHHAKLNNLEIKTEALGFSDFDSKVLSNVDIIFGVEVCYSEEASLELTQLFKESYESGVQQIFIADPGRPDFLDTVSSNVYKYKKEIYKLPGTVNGKVTHLLHLYL